MSGELRVHFHLNVYIHSEALYTNTHSLSLACTIFYPYYPHSNEASMYLLADNSVPDLNQYRPYSTLSNPIASKSSQNWTLSERLLTWIVVIPLFLVLVYFCKKASPTRTSLAPGCQTIAKDFSSFNMPPVRGPMNTKELKTERTHEENQERFVVPRSHCSHIMLMSLPVPTLQHPDEATAAWKHGLNQPGAHLRSISAVPAELFAFPSKM